MQDGHARMTTAPAGPGTPPPATVRIYSDLGCPWASLALHHLRRARVEEGVALTVEHRAFPLELFNARPTPKWILDPEVAAITELEPALGWSAWSGPESGYPVTMLPAMEAVQAAKHPDAGGPGASDALDAALRHAFYAEHRCVSVHSEIVAVARDCPEVDEQWLDRALRTGRFRAELFTQWEQSQSPEVRGSPHLFLADGSSLHNPGITFGWPKGAARPEITSYEPEIWNELVCRAAGHR